MKRTAKAIRAKSGLPTGDMATIHFMKDSADILQETLKNMIGLRFDYKDQDGTHYVQLEGLGAAPGNVWLQDLKTSLTARPKRTGCPYLVSLYEDGILTL